jgi:hypothetical protein
MKNKALTYVLLLVVGLIWYQVFYRVSDNFFGEEVAVPSPNSPLQGDLSIERDTFALQANYRDPFIEERAVVAQVEAGPQRPPAPQPVRPAKIKPAWPAMTYFGQVRKTESKNPLAILKVDGMQLMLRRGDEVFNDIFLKEIWRDSVQLTMKKEKKTIYRNPQ